MLQVMYASSTVHVSCLQVWSGRVSHLHHRRHVMHDTLSKSTNITHLMRAVSCAVNSLDADTTAEERNRLYDCSMQFMGP